MLTPEENDLLTRVGPGTPAGALLRRYWLPVAVGPDLTDEHPTKFVRILGEDLVLFQDKQGRVGLLADHCPHRGASLLYGRVEERGIACAYHGWLYDIHGNCLETPAEPADSNLHLTIKQTAYPVQKLIGLYWAYLGPEPAPVLPHYDLWVRKDGRRRITVRPVLDCNWLQPMENTADPLHVSILHQNTTARGRTPPSTTRGFVDDIISWDVSVAPYGLMKRRVYQDGGDGYLEEHPILFPNIVRQANATQIRVPVDDTHTAIIDVRFDPTEDGRLIEGEGDPPVGYVTSYKEPPGALHPFTWFDMQVVTAQDYMAWETQGPLADREAEHLATSDRGVVLLRELLKENIERVQAGLDPYNLIRDPDHPMIDTNLTRSIEELRRSGSSELRPVLA